LTVGRQNAALHQFKLKLKKHGGTNDELETVRRSLSTGRGGRRVGAAVSVGRAGDRENPPQRFFAQKAEDVREVLEGKVRLTSAHAKAATN